MNQKAYSVLFCALLASTFVHELRAKGVAPVSHRLKHYNSRAEVTSSETCELQCSYSKNFTFGLTVQVVSDVLVIANLTAKAALLINATANIAVLLNGTSGAGIALDLAAQTGVYIKSGLWTGGSIEVFIQSLTGGLRAIFSISGAVSFSFSSVSSAILQVVNQIVVKLIANISLQLEKEAIVGLQLVVAISAGIVSLLKGALSGLLSVIGATVVQITIDLAGLLNVLEGFAEIVVKVGGTIAALVAQGVVFKIQLILGAANGLQALINILLQIGAKVSLSAAASLFSNVENFFKLVVKLGGGLAIGITGVFAVVAKIIAFANKNETLEVVISTLIEFLAYSQQYSSGDISGSLNSTLSVFVEACEKFNINGTVISAVKSLIAGSLVIGGLSISAIIDTLLTGIVAGASNLLVVLVSVVLLLTAAVSSAVSIPYILLVLLCKLYSALGVQQLIALGIGINFSILSNLVSILLSSVTIIVSVLTGDLYTALTRISVIGTIVTALNAAVESASNGQISLKTLLNASALVKSLIKGFFQFIASISFGVASSVVSQVKAIVEVTSSTSACVHVNVTASVAVGVSSG